MTITAGSVFLSRRWGPTSLITAPSEKRQTIASLDLKSSSTCAGVGLSNHTTSGLPSENFTGAKTTHEGKNSFILRPIRIPFLVIARTDIFSTPLFSRLR